MFILFNGISTCKGSLKSYDGPRPSLRPQTTCVTTAQSVIIAAMKYLIVDDHAVLRKGMRALLQQAGSDALVLEAADGAEGLELASLHPDLDAVFLDLEMPGMGGMSAIEAYGKQRPDLPVIVLSSSEDPRDVRRALAAGALGYIPKSASSETLLAALQLVLQGNVYVPPLMLNEPLPPGTEAKPAHKPEAATRLTGRQIEVLRLLERGLSNKEIGLALNLSEKTVKVHVTSIFKALNVVNRTQAATAARSSGLT
jgi:two-component system nitrate/nitrite response regulator NarL